VHSLILALATPVMKATGSPRTLNFETDGVRLEAKDVLGYAAPFLEHAGGLGPALRTEFAAYCGDVSASAAWRRVAAAPARFCACRSSTRSEPDGTRSYAVEAALEDTSHGWVFLAR
jgi:hypothetical protein